jgi:fatty-acyl-CoA synthase
MTSVGKIFKPELRNDAARRLVADEVAKAIGAGDVAVDVAAGGKRGMDVIVKLPAQHASKRQAAEAALEGYVFDYKVITSVD